MDRKFKIFLVIVFFPITIFCYIVKKLYNFVKRKILHKYFATIKLSQIDCLDGHSFEEFLYIYLKSLGYNVKRTPKSRDYGADLIIKTKSETIVIQCKNYYNHNVGNSAIQEIATAKDYYNATIGIVITNWFFTTPAQTLADKVGVKLIDRNILTEILSSPKKLRYEYLITSSQIN